MSHHIKLSAYEKKPRNSTQQDDVVTSKCVVTISNYCWFQRTKERPSKTIKCTPHDFDVGFKLSSTSFATERNAHEEYHFDKSGIRLSYTQFYQLMRSEIFTVEFLNKVRKYLKRDEKMNVGLEPEDHDDEGAEMEVVVTDTIEEEEEDVPLVRTTTTTSASSATVKRLKRL